MTKEEIQHLGTLARIKLSDEEIAALGSEIEAILEYVSRVKDAVADGGLEKTVGPVHNVFREDAVTNEPGVDRDALLAAMPEHDENYLHVKKILNPDA